MCDDRTVTRWLCLTCRRSFSEQSFSTTWYLKRPELLEPVATAVVACAAHRQAARSLGCAPSTVTRMVARLGRHAILRQAQLLEDLPRIEEVLVHDDFETFAYSQEQPMGIGTTIGRDTWFLFGPQPAPHRRGGKKRRGNRKRHSRSHFRRETIAFGRRHCALLERSFVFMVWRNLIKGRSERRPDPRTPAMWLGLTDAPWDWKRLLAQRLIPSRLRVPAPWMRIYRRDRITPAVRKNQRHRLVHAF